MNYKDLIVDKYYKYCYNRRIYYTKIKAVDINLIRVYFTFNRKSFNMCTNYTYLDEKCKIIEQINISRIYKYLPDENIDKIIYLRKIKINSLLRI